MTIRQLLEDIKIATTQDKTILDKEILLSSDDEGNSYHEMYYSITSKPNDVKECIENSNGVDHMDDVDYDKFVILG